jgi:hypothetical protein
MVQSIVTSGEGKPHKFNGPATVHISDVKGNAVGEKLKILFPSVGAIPCFEEYILIRDTAPLNYADIYTEASICFIYNDSGQDVGYEFSV